MLNPLLYHVLKNICTDVNVVNEGQKRIATTSPDGEEVVTQYGESYYVDCWCCGDTKRRLSISYRFLTKKYLSSETYTHVYHCFNEGCNILNSPEFKRIDAAIKDGAQDARLLAALPRSQQVAAAVPMRLPFGFTSLLELPSGHPALDFITSKYPGFTPEYLWKCYRVGYTEAYDDDYKLSRNRIIFPVFGDDGSLAGWQGRTIDKASPKRWYLPPGFRKEVIYNAHRVPSSTVPVVAEGIPAAIACGPTGICLFGKEMSEHRAAQFAQRWKSAIIATDPETFVPDLRVKVKPGKQPPIYARKLKEVLDKYLQVPAKLITWPQEAIELAKQKVAGKDVTVPDPADLGMSNMARLIGDCHAR